MRGLVLIVFVLILLAYTFRRPYIGIYAWTWFSLMNPHRLTYGFANSFPFASVIGLVTLIGLFTGKQEKLNVWSRETIVLLMLVLWVCFTTIFAFHVDGALAELDRFLKIQIFIFLTVILISDKKKLDWYIWVIVVSIGFYGVKGGIFTIATGGGSRVWGPEGSFIGGNNEIALAMLMTIPLMWYLFSQAENKWIRRGLIVAMLLNAASILGSQSRGAFLGIMAIGFFFWLKSRKKLAATMIVAVVAALVLVFMPESWWARMETIKSYEEDASAMGRINAWWVAFNVANDRITGGGANMFTRDIFAIYAPNPIAVHDVHSIYFEMLGEQGWIGFMLFMLLGIFTWLRCSRIVKIAKGNPEFAWAADLALMLQVSIVGYATAGAFLGLAYFDFYYDLVAATVITWKLIEKGGVGKFVDPLLPPGRVPKNIRPLGSRFTGYYGFSR